MERDVHGLYRNKKIIRYFPKHVWKNKENLSMKVNRLKPYKVALNAPRPSTAEINSSGITRLP